MPTNTTSPRLGSCTVRRFVGPFLFFVSMIAVLAIGDQLNSITWRQMVSLSAFPLITGYAAYACGFINGHHEGYMKSEDERRPNPGVHPSPDASAGVGGATRCCGSYSEAEKKDCKMGLTS